jgi:hypothetical protein
MIGRLGTLPTIAVISVIAIILLPAILILRFHDIKTLAPRGVNNS